MQRRRNVLLAVFGLLLSWGTWAQAVLRTEFQDTQPKFILGADGKFSGLCIEIMDLLTSRSGFKFTYPRTFVPIPRIDEDLKTGAIDVYFGLAKDQSRLNNSIFVDKLFTTRYQIVARKGDPAAAFTTLEQLQAAKIPIMLSQGGAPARYFEKIPGLVFDEIAMSIEIGFRQLKTGHGRLFGYYDLGNNWYIQNEQYRSSVVAVPVRFELADQWICVRNGLPQDQIDKLSATLDAIKKGPEWAAIMKRYFPSE